MQKDGRVLRRRRRHDIERRLPYSRLLCVDRHLKPVPRGDPRIRPRSEGLRGKIEGMQLYSKLRDPRQPRPRFGRIEVNMPRQPCHQQRWRASRRSTGDVSSQDARNREPASRHHTKVGDLLLQGLLQAKPAGVLPQYDERSYSTSLDSQPMYGGADATGHSAIANDATASTHRRRDPGESLHGGPTLSEPVVPPVAVGHEREPIRQGLAAIRVFQLTAGGSDGCVSPCRAPRRGRQPGGSCRGREGVVSPRGSGPRRVGSASGNGSRVRGR